MKILVVAPDCPYPPNHGGRKDVYTRLELLHGLGHQVELVFTTYAAPDAAAMAHLETLCSKVVWVKRSKLPWLVPLLQSFQLRSRRALASVALAGDYDSLLLESEYVASILDNRTLRARRIGLRVHNNEADYYRALAESATNPLKRAYFLSEAAFFARMRERLFRRVDALLFISHDEFASVDSPNKHFLPTYVAPQRFVDMQAGASVVFVGNLFAQNNLAGLKWYLDEVHPRLLANPAYHFVVAGNTRGVVPDFLRDAGMQRMRFIDSPEDLADVYRQGAVFVNPMLSGAGVKIKTVDAVVNGLPVVSTSVGAEGIGLRHGETVLIADDAAGFGEAVDLLLRDRDQARRMFGQARDFLARNYASAERVASLL
ncbi:glycosyltransferase family 4 protein [Massilia sp. SYSU DXS3249]